LNWVEWIQRTTHQAEAKFAQLNIEDWVTGCHKRKLEWAGTLAENKQNWVSRVIAWQPDQNKHKRAHARPRRRWIDEIIDVTENLATSLIS